MLLRLIVKAQQHLRLTLKSVEKVSAAVDLWTATKAHQGRHYKALLDVIFVLAWRGWVQEGCQFFGSDNPSLTLYVSSNLCKIRNQLSAKELSSPIEKGHHLGCHDGFYVKCHQHLELSRHR